MTEKSMRYLELLAQKEWHRATNKLTQEAALRYAAHLDRIWNDLDEDEQAAIDAELSAIDGRPSKQEFLCNDSSDIGVAPRQAA